MATGSEGEGVSKTRNRGAVVNEAEDVKGRSNYIYVKSHPFQMIVAKTEAIPSRKEAPRRA